MNRPLSSELASGEPVLFGQQMYAQICYLLADDEAIKREYGSFEGIRGSCPKMVVSLDDVVFGSRNGIQHRQAWQVLAEPSSR